MAGRSVVNLAPHVGGGPLPRRGRVARSAAQRGNRPAHLEGATDSRALLRPGASVPDLLDAIRCGLAAGAARQRRSTVRARSDSIHQRCEPVSDLHLESDGLLDNDRGSDRGCRSRDHERGRAQSMTPGDRFEELYRAFDHTSSASDPVHIVRRFGEPADREVVGFCAAGLAFGRVSSVLQSIEALLQVMGPSPAVFVRDFDPVRHGPRLAPLVHRWIRGRDLIALLLVLQRMLCESGSIEAFFREGDDSSQAHIGAALDAFSTRALRTELRAAYGRRLPKARGVSYFFPRPSSGSACKRLNLLL